MSMPGESPDKGAALSDASEKKLAEWMVKQQNRVDDELKDIHQIVVKIDKQVAIESVKNDEAHRRFDEFRADNKAAFQAGRDDLKTAFQEIKSLIEKQAEDQKEQLAKAITSIVEKLDKLEKEKVDKLDKSVESIKKFTWMFYGAVSLIGIIALIVRFWPTVSA